MSKIPSHHRNSILVRRGHDGMGEGDRNQHWLSSYEVPALIGVYISPFNPWGQGRVEEDIPNGSPTAGSESKSDMILKQVDRRRGKKFLVFALCIKYLHMWSKSSSRYYHSHFADEQAKGSRRFIIVVVLHNHHHHNTNNNYYPRTLILGQALQMLYIHYLIPTATLWHRHYYDHFNCEVTESKKAYITWSRSHTFRTCWLWDSNSNPSASKPIFSNTRHATS